MRYVYLSLLLLSVMVLCVGVWWYSPHATLKITTGPAGGSADRFVSALISVMKKEHPRVRIVPVLSADLDASARALENGKVDLAIVRTDVAPPMNGQTIAILRREAVGIVLPTNSKIDAVAELRGKSVGIFAGPLQGANEKILDSILAYYNVPVASVHRKVLAPEDLAKEIHARQVSAVLAVGKVGPGELVDAVALVTKAGGGAASLLAFDDADAFSKQNPAFESLDLAKGVLKAKPEIPDDSVTTLAVSYRLVAPEVMLSAVAGAIGQAIFTSKPRLLAATPLASGIEAPDPDEHNAILPIHPGISNYLTNGTESFFDEFQAYFYIFGFAIGMIASLWTLLLGYLSRSGLAAERKTVTHLIEIADRARKATPPELQELENELHKTVSDMVRLRISPEVQSTAALAASHARHMIDSQKGLLAIER
jgi:TRAP-type uncharacterized transport system substrate-binding protein